jgi:hypothetical protein
MKVVIIVIFFVAATLQSLASSALPNFSSISQARNEIPSAIQDLVKTPSAKKVRELFFMCQRIPENHNANTWASDREFKLTSFLALLVAIDLLKDPKFDPNQPKPSFEAPVPPGSGIMSGEDPKDVSNPVLRLKYEQMIKANNTLLATEQLQDSLIVVRQECAGYAKSFIKNRYSTGNGMRI